MLTLQIISIFLIVCSVLHFSKYEAWWIRIFDFIHLQLGTLMLITLIIALRVFDASYVNIMIIVAMSAVLIYHFFRVLPFTRLYKPQVATTLKPDSNNGISLMVSNVYQPNNRYDMVRNIIQSTHADINLLLEVDDKWVHSLKDIEKEFATVISYPLPNTYGMILYSRLPIVSHKINFLVANDFPSMECQVKLKSGKVIDLFCTHPPPPSPTENERSTERDAELLIIAKRVNKMKPTLVMGDLNDVAWSYTTRLFRKMSGLLDVRIGRGLFSTFHAKVPFFRFPLDHVFVSTHFSVTQVRTLPSCNSDHFAIYVELCCSTRVENEPEELPTQGDKETAHEKIAKATA
jgi:endonuclease/exonuclease/phosphatase (EEP) superfamily protein YafD